MNSRKLIYNFFGIFRLSTSSAKVTFGTTLLPRSETTSSASLPQKKNLITMLSLISLCTCCALYVLESRNVYVYPFSTSVFHFHLLNPMAGVLCHYEVIDKSLYRAPSFGSSVQT